MSSPTIRIRGGGREVSGYGLALGMVPVEQDAAYWEWHVAMPPGTKRRSSHDAAREMEEDAVDDDDDDCESFHDVGVDDDDDDPYALKFGVATRKDRAFYVNLENGDDGGDREFVDDGTALMRPISDLRHGDVIGVAVQQSDLPMIQILHNGEPLSRCTISRFRGTVYPAVYIPPGGGHGGRDEGGGGDGGLYTRERLEDVDDDDDGRGGNGGRTTSGGATFSIYAEFDEENFREMSPHARFGPLLAARGII
ncbi:hypothetical protein ACHAXA_010585 [Cyclostephanos tholiformis]|uniref:SPRY domain-containing protein n=1 Tax=Cyclostephanos tholiformis TaxID=382380 RepID=A0ABD3RZD2_9STRA